MAQDVKDVQISCECTAFQTAIAVSSVRIHLLYLFSLVFQLSWGAFMSFFLSVASFVYSLYSSRLDCTRYIWSISTKRLNILVP